jgi:hypothetical protein
MDPEHLQASLRSSRAELDQAGAALESLLRGLARTSRAEKSTIGVALQKALEKVRAARRQLDLLEQAARAKDEPT